MSNKDDAEIDLRTIHRKLQDMDNKLERIKSDTHNLNRIQTLSNSSIIIQELKKAIGNSEVRAALLHLTKDEINAGDLARKLGINSSNLGMYVKPFLGNKGYIAVMEKGRERYFQRSELVDLVGYESIEDFAKLIKSWEEKAKTRGGPAAETAIKDDANAT